MKSPRIILLALALFTVSTAPVRADEPAPAPAPAPAPSPEPAPAPAPESCKDLVVSYNKLQKEADDICKPNVYSRPCRAAERLADAAWAKVEAGNCETDED